MNTVAPKDSAKKKVQLFEIGVNGGYALPFGNYYSIGTNYAGYASPGYLCNLNLRINTYKGWELAVLGSYYDNKMNVNSYLRDYLSKNYKNYYYYNLVAKVGKNFYNQYSFLIGIAKDFYISKLFFAGGHIMIGQFFVSATTIKANADTISRYNYQNGDTIKGKLNMNISGLNNSWKIWDFGMNVGIRIGWDVTNSFAIIFSTDYVFGESPYYMILGTHNSNINLFNYCLGVEYKFL